ncbi:MAG: MarR family transcriptional regulator [Christensenellaceae bacterium]|nr:MarR family transcriptional regulator [Christensenellaceae bacterium]
MQLNQCINFLLNKTQNAVLIHFRGKLEQFNVTPVQYAVLRCLWDEDMLSPKQIAQEISLDASTITGILSRLENKNLICRKPCSTDRRTLIVELTDEGKALEEGINRIILEANHEVLADLSEEEQALLKNCLERVCTTCHNMRGE